MMIKDLPYDAVLALRTHLQAKTDAWAGYWKARAHDRFNNPETEETAASVEEAYSEYMKYQAAVHLVEGVIR